MSTEETTFTDPEMVTCVLAAFRTVKLLPSAAKGSVRLGFRPGAPALPLSLRTVGSDAKVGGAPAKRATLKDIAAALERAGLREVVVTEADSATRACGRVRARRDADEVTVFFYPDIAASDGPRLAPDDLDQYKRSGAIVTDQTFLVAAVFSSGKVSAARALLREIVSGEDVEK